MATTEQRDKNKQAALQVIDVWDGGDPDSLDGVVAEDVVLNAVDQQGRGRDTYKGRVHMFRKAFPNLIFEANEVVAEDDTFDIAGSSNGVSIFPDLEQGLRELVRVTKPGGQVLIVTFGPPEKMEWLGLFKRAMQAAIPDLTGTDAPSPAFRLADPEKLRHELTDVGLNDVRMETVTWDFEVQSGMHFWNVMSHANPKAAAMLADLTEEQKVNSSRQSTTYSASALGAILSSCPARFTPASGRTEPPDMTAHEQPS